MGTFEKDQQQANSGQGQQRKGILVLTATSTIHATPWLSSLYSRVADNLAALAHCWTVTLAIFTATLSMQCEHGCGIDAASCTGVSRNSHASGGFQEK